MKLPTSTGFSKIAWFNSGKMTNRGWEFRVDLNDIVKTKDWRFTFSFNISQNENKVNEFPSNLDMENYEFGNGKYAYLIMSGNPLGSFYGYRYKGVYQNTDDTYARDLNGNIINDINGKPVVVQNGTEKVYPGDAKYEDINGDGVYWLAEIGISSHLYRMLPYIITLLVLAFTSKKSRAPKAEGIPYDKGQR